MELNKVHKVYFLGIGGIGMSALARYFAWTGRGVSGYDRVCTPLTRELEAEGIPVHYDDDPERISKDIDMVVVTPAVPSTAKEYMHLEKSGIPMLKRAEVLGHISREVPAIAVAGTHGKTTVTTMLAHILKTLGVECSAFMGGISANYNTNFIPSREPLWMVVEADEFDRSFLHLQPEIAIVTSMDADHLDVYGDADAMAVSFRNFVGKINPNGALVAHQSLESIHPLHPHCMTYALAGNAHFSAENIRVADGRYYCRIKGFEQPINLTLGMPGRHNLENALGAIVTAHAAGIDAQQAAKAMESYRGVKRRFDVLVNRPQRVYIDDYAHHPSELKACILSARELFPEKRITGVFQPHLFSRTRDFAVGFAQALDLLDEAVLLDIYPARELPIEGVDSFLIMDKMQNPRKHNMADEDLLDYIRGNSFDVLITMGAGDIDRFVEPIKKIMES